MPRSFVSIVPPDEIIATIARIQNGFVAHSGKVRWEHREKFHFTLLFLGEKTPQWIETFTESCRAYLIQKSAIPVILNSVGCFPSPASPKIIWIGSPPAENNALCTMQTEIESIGVSLGHRREDKPFHPHITLGRVKGKIPSHLIKKLETTTFEPLEFRCSEIRIVKSVLASSGSTYTTLASLPLK